MFTEQRDPVFLSDGVFYIPGDTNVGMITSENNGIVELYLVDTGVGSRVRIRVTDSYSFTQSVNFELDYDNPTLAKVLSLRDGSKDAPRLDINFDLKDYRSYRKELIADAYNDAKNKVEITAAAASCSNIRCAAVDLEGARISLASDLNSEYETGVVYRRASRSSELPDSKEFLQRINASFTPNNITVSLSISTSWEVD